MGHTGTERQLLADKSRAGDDPGHECTNSKNHDTNDPFRPRTVIGVLVVVSAVRINALITLLYNYVALDPVFVMNITALPLI